MTQTTNTVNNSCTVESFANIAFFLPDTFDYSKCFHDSETDIFCFMTDMSKLSDNQYLDDQQKTSVQALAENNLCLLLEYSNAVKKLEEKTTNVCIYDLSTEEIIARCPNQKLGNQRFYDRLEFVCKYLPDKTAEGLVEETKIIEIEPTIKSLYEELQKYQTYSFYVAERDNKDRTTFGFDFTATKMQLSGYKIEFLIKSGEGRHSTFSILNSVCKIKRELVSEDYSERYYFKDYKFTLNFTGSDVPLEFFASISEHRKEVK